MGQLAFTWLASIPVWTTAPSTQRLYACRQALLLAQGFRQAGLGLDPRLSAEVKRNLTSFSETEWKALGSLDLQVVSRAQAGHLLGTGFALTGFLIAPVAGTDADHNRLHSLGAILNLLAVVCDRLLDSGSSAEDVLSESELTAGGGNSSVVTILLGEYYRRLQLIGLDERLRHTIDKCFRRMFDAETRTVGAGDSFPYRYWLRKCALPFVVMALPALAIDRSDYRRFSRAVSSRHLRWLYSVGRFFGAIDDAVDYQQDLSSNHPNCWRTGRRQSPRVDPGRVVDWGRRILSQWGSMVPETKESAVLRETFLYTLWEGLKPAIPAYARQ